MVVDNSLSIGLSIDPLTFVLHSIATFGVILYDESLITFGVRPLVSLCLQYRSSVTGIFPLLDQLHQFDVQSYQCGLCFLPNNGAVEFHHEGYKSFLVTIYLPPP